MNAITKLGLLCFLPLCVTAGRAQSWQHFSTPDRSLSVELPAKPSVLRKGEESLEMIFENVKSAHSYGVNLGLESEPRIVFCVLKLSKTMNNRTFDETVNSSMLWIGGDDKHFSKESDVVLSGWHGREFVYQKGVMSGRALFINSGSRIYYLIVQTEIENGMRSEVVSRVFNTFRPLQRTRIPRK